MPFPTQFPQKQMQHILASLVGQESEPLPVLVESAYDVLGYGLFLGLTQQPPPAAAMPEAVECCDLSCDDKAEIFRAAVHPQATGIPWEMIVSIVLELLSKWRRS